MKKGEGIYRHSAYGYTYMTEELFTYRTTGMSTFPYDPERWTAEEFREYLAGASRSLTFELPKEFVE